MIVQKQGPGCLIQALWFLFIGWWAGGVVLTVAWVLNVTIIGLPLGMMLLNNIPKVLALQEPVTILTTSEIGGQTVAAETGQPQLNFLLRAAFFLLIGWWWSGLWLSLAYILCATIILLPVGLSMFRLTPAMTTLRRY